MSTRIDLKRIATWLVCALLFGQLTVAAHACPDMRLPIAPAAEVAIAVDDASAAMACCDGAADGSDAMISNVCAEHCKQGQQSDRAHAGMTVPPALLNALYETSALVAPVHLRPLTRAWLSALVAASPPHAIAHCVLRI